MSLDMFLSVLGLCTIALCFPAVVEGTVKYARSRSFAGVAVGLIGVVMAGRLLGLSLAMMVAAQ